MAGGVTVSGSAGGEALAEAPAGIADEAALRAARFSARECTHTIRVSKTTIPTALVTMTLAGIFCTIIETRLVTSVTPHRMMVVRCCDRPRASN